MLKLNEDLDKLKSILKTIYNHKRMYYADNATQYEKDQFMSIIEEFDKEYQKLNYYTAIMDFVKNFEFPEDF